MSIQSNQNRFLWVKLQVEHLCREKIEDDVTIALENNLPEDLDQLYQDSLSHIFKTGMTARDAAIRIFSWMLHMREPLTPSALLGAVSNGHKSTMQLSELMALCANLVVLDKYCNVIRFAHQSVKDFLERQDAFTDAMAHNLLASTCIEVCSRGPVSRKSLKYPSDDFYVYASMYWPIHSKMAESIAANKDIVNNMTSFIFDEEFDTTLSFNSWLETTREIVPMLANDHDMKLALDAIPDNDAGPLFLISVFGLTSLLRVVFEQVEDLDVNQKNKHGHTLVYLAAALGHSAALSLLVDHGADVNVQCGKYGSPLHAACFAGQLEAVKTLRKLDANMSCGAVFDNAFQAACQGGQEAVVLLLIESDTLVKSENDYDKVLEGAARAGFVGVVEKLQGPPFLLFNNSKPDKVRKKMRKAIQGGQLGVIRQFLDQQTKRSDALPLDAIALATLYNHRALVEFFLNEGMSVQAEGAFGTPLRTACLLNYQPIARLLLQRGAEINACGTFGDALQAAAMRGHTMVVKLITEEGANVNQQSGFYGTALQAAAYHGQLDAVEFLLDAGANVHAKGYSIDAFHAAAEGGHQDVIMLMLRKGYGYKFGHPITVPQYRRVPRSPYKALMRDASPGRGSDPYGQKPSSRALKDVSVKATRPITDLEAIFRLAEPDSETTRVHSEEIPAVGYRPQFNKFDRELYVQNQENSSLAAAASAGSEASVKVLLEQREVLGIPEDDISHAIRVAASNSHGPVVQLLLDDVAERQSVKPHIGSILEILCQRQQSPIVGLALDRASKYCSTDEIVEFKRKLVPAVDKYHYDSEVSQETLILDFEKGCKLGDVQIIDAILASKHHETLSPHEIDSGLQLCVLNGQTTVVQQLCESLSIKGRLPPSGEEAFVVAAGNGSVNMMRLLTSYWMAELTKSNSVAVDRALVVSSENGHIEVVRYLAQAMSADVNTLAHDKPVGTILNKSPWTISPFAIDPDDFESQSQARQEEPTVVPVISPLQAALRGFSRFSPSENGDISISFFSENEPRKAERSQQEEVIVFLLSNGSSLSHLGGQKVYPIQMAAEFCPVHIVEMFVSANTDINVTIEGKSALFRAAGREMSSASIVRRLLAAGATIPEKLEEQEKLLNQALRYFEGNSDGHFLEAPSLEYVFSEGSGAVLFDLLNLMPQVTTADITWTLVLQMAALLNNLVFLDLLLSRGTDVNAIGYYYGTALEAAARYGHISIVQRLLDEGVHVNVVGGRWQTALRAAVVGRHEEVVETLLKHGANMELRLARQPLYMDYSKQASYNALQLGVQGGSLSIVKALLKHGANAMHDAIETLHPLILASKQGNVAIIKELLDVGAPINIVGNNQSSYEHVQAEDASPMHAAVAGGYLDVIKMLLSQGADIETNVEGPGTPLSVAASKGRADIVRLLLSAGANAIEGPALYHGVREGSIEVAQELLTAGSKAEPVLALACRQGSLPMIEILLEKVYDGEKPETVIDEAFAIHGLGDPVFQLLLDYAHPTMKRFAQVCAAGSVASAEIMLAKGDIDINGQIETNGDYPLQVAALHLRAEMVRFLLTSGADVNRKSAKHGTPLMTSLEACAASTLRSMKSEKAKEFVERLSLPNPKVNRFYTSSPNSFQQNSDCEHIVHLLLIHGANIANDNRPFGSPIHLACLLGSKGLVELLLEKGADLSATAGFFEKPIFAAIQGGHTDVVELVLQKAPLTKYIHPDYATPLHLACDYEFSAAVRKLLEHGADVTVSDANGWTPLTIALEKKRQRSASIYRSHTEAPLEIILELANPLRVLDEDLITAAKLDNRDAEKTLALLLNVAKDMVVSEAVICNALNRTYVDNQIIQLLMSRNGGIGVTAKMLKAVKNHCDLKDLLQHRPICKITPEILKSQKELECMKLLLEIAPETPVTEEVVLRALQFGNSLDRMYIPGEQEGKGMLETLLDRSPDIAVSEEMLQAVRCAADMEILLNHLDPGTHISADVIAAVSKLKHGEAYRTMRPLLRFDPSIRLDHDMVLQMIVQMIVLPDTIDALEMFLDHDPSLPVPKEIFLQIFWGSRASSESNRGKLADLMHKYGKRLVFTDEVREAIDRAYPSKDEAAKKKRFYSLRVNDEADIELAGDSRDEETPMGVDGKEMTTRSMRDLQKDIAGGDAAAMFLSMLHLQMHLTHFDGD